MVKDKHWKLLKLVVNQFSVVIYIIGGVKAII